MKKASGRVAFTGLLAALALSFSFLEGLIPPIPVLPPGAKLGPVSYTHLTLPTILLV